MIRLIAVRRIRYLAAADTFGVDLGEPEGGEDHGVNDFMGEKGREEGLKEGIQQGIQQGLQQGLQRGRTETQFEIAKRLLKMGMSQEDVVKATGSEREELEKLAGQETEDV